jgi:hypothetical protein
MAPGERETSLRRKIPYFRRRRADLQRGDRVILNVPLMGGQAGTLLRPARLLNGKPAWLVRMDNPRGLWKGRTRVAERSLVKAE